MNNQSKRGSIRVVALALMATYSVEFVARPFSGIISGHYKRPHRTKVDVGPHAE